MEPIIANETQAERRQNDWYAFLFELVLLILVMLLLSFTSHAQTVSTSETQKGLEWNEIQIGSRTIALQNFGTEKMSAMNVALADTVHSDGALHDAAKDTMNRDARKNQQMVEQKVLAPVKQVLQEPTVAAQRQQTEQAKTARVIVISVPRRKLALLEGGKVVKIYTIAVGKRSTPTPAGTFYVVNRVDHPSWSHKGKTAEPGPHNPVGSRWIGLSAKGYGIHGTNEPNSIGKAASHGCIRMAKADIEQLFSQVQIGDEVTIHTTDDDQVSAIFDPQSDTTQTAQVAADIMPGPANGQ